MNDTSACKFIHFLGSMSHIGTKGNVILGKSALDTAARLLKIYSEESLAELNGAFSQVRVHRIVVLALPKSSNSEFLELYKNKLHMHFVYHNFQSLK